LAARALMLRLRAAWYRAWMIGVFMVYPPYFLQSFIGPPGT